MSERSRVILIFAIVGAVVGGGVFYFFKIYRPAKDLENAQTEITTWEKERWQAARDCLLGKTPGSSKTSEALAIREMAPDPWERGSCTPLVRTLVRGDAPDTGIPAIETAWGALDKAAQKAAFAFADHVARSTTIAKDPLPEALDALDAARAALRAAAELPAMAGAGAPLPVVQTVQLADGTDPVTSLEIDSVPSAHGLVVFGKTSSRLVQIAITAGGAPRIDRIGPASLRGVPDSSWGATPGMDRVDAGAFDPEGVLATPSALKVKEPGAVVAAVIGSPAQGALLYGTQNQLYVARSVAGAIQAQPPTQILWAMAATDLDGRAALAFESTEKKVFARILRAADSKDEAMTELPPGQVVQACLTRDRAWLATHGAGIAFGGGLAQSRKETGARILQGCTTDAALFRERSTGNHLVCIDDCRAVAIPSGAPEQAATTLVGGKLVAVASHGGVLGVWREDGPPRFFAMPEAAKPVLSQESVAMAMTDGKVIDVIARGEKTFVILRIPAS